MSSRRTASEPWQDHDLVMRASAYAADVHRYDLRKGTTIPYLSHLWSVAALTLEHGGDDTQVAAALLHDTVEDHGGTSRLADVREHFGDEVARLVEALSDSVVDTTAGAPRAPWKQRKSVYLRHLTAADDRVKLVSACDKLHNARSIVADQRQHGDAMWARFSVQDPAEHLWYYRGLVDALAGGVPAALATQLARSVEELEALISGGGR